MIRVYCWPVSTPPLPPVKAPLAHRPRIGWRHPKPVRHHYVYMPKSVVLACVAVTIGGGIALGGGLPPYPGWLGGGLTRYEEGAQPGGGAGYPSGGADYAPRNGFPDGTTARPEAVPLTKIPEPSSLVTLLMAMVSLLAVRRRR